MLSWRFIRSNILGAVAWILLGICIFWFVRIIISDDDNLRTILPGIFSDNYDGTRIGAAEYLTFIIGVPAALLTSVVAIIIAAATRDNSAEQSLIQKIELLDKKFDAASSAYFRNIAVVEDFASDISRARFEHIQLEREKAELESQDQNDPQYQRYQSDLMQQQERFESSFLKIKESLSTLNSRDDLFWKRAEQIHLENAPNWRTVFDVVTRPINGRHYAELNRPRDFIRRLTFLASATDSTEFQRLNLCMPSRTWSSPIERAGALLWIVDEDDWLADIVADTFSEGDEPILFFNIGAAMIVAAVNAVPDANSIKQTAELTFGKEAVQRKSYLSAIDVLKEYRSEAFNEMVETINSEPWQLIYKFNGPGEVGRIDKAEYDLLLSKQNLETKHTFSFGLVSRHREPSQVQKNVAFNRPLKSQLSENNLKTYLARDLRQ
ncbi:MAG: hypothetical protein R3C51_11225 [Parvularculaceae bacterium]